MAKISETIKIVDATQAYWDGLRARIIAIHGMTDTLLFHLDGEDKRSDNEVMANILARIAMVALEGQEDSDGVD